MDAYEAAHYLTSQAEYHHGTSLLLTVDRIKLETVLVGIFLEVLQLTRVPYAEQLVVLIAGGSHKVELYVSMDLYIGILHHNCLYIIIHSLFFVDILHDLK